MANITLKGRSVIGGVAEGEAMVTKKAFSFAHGLDPTTGKITDAGIPEWLGQSVKGKVLVYPFGKGSGMGAMYILQACKRGNAPAAIINIETDLVPATGLVWAELLYNKQIPVIEKTDKSPIETIKPGDKLKVDGNKGTIEIVR